MVIGGTVTDKIGRPQAGVRSDAGADVRHLVRIVRQLRRSVLGFLLGTKGVDQIIPVVVLARFACSGPWRCATASSCSSAKIAGDDIRGEMVVRRTLVSLSAGLPRPLTLSDDASNYDTRGGWPGT